MYPAQRAEIDGRVALLVYLRGPWREDCGPRRPFAAAQGPRSPRLLV